MDARVRNSVGYCLAIRGDMIVRYLDFAKEESKQGTIVSRLCRGSAINMHDREQGNLGRGEEFEEVS